MDRYNSEGYADPTVPEAIANVRKLHKPLVYVASPFAGDTETNIERAREYCRFVVSRDRIPLAPHLFYPQFMDDGDNDEREQGLLFALVLLGKCDELWAFGDRVSDGMARELERARNRGIPIRRFNSRCQEVS